jgi:hypothetical protein
MGWLCAGRTWEYANTTRTAEQLDEENTVEEVEGNEVIVTSHYVAPRSEVSESGPRALRVTAVAVRGYNQTLQARR